MFFGKTAEFARQPLRRLWLLTISLAIISGGLISAEEVEPRVIQAPEAIAYLDEIGAMWHREVTFIAAPSGAMIEENFLRNISPLRGHLWELNMNSTKIEPGALKRLPDFQGLRRLFLTGCSIQDDDLAPIGRLPHLQVLLLANTPINGSGLRSLSAMKSLEYLDLERTNVTPESLGALTTLAGLEELYLSGTAADNSVVAQLHTLRNLTTLELGGTKIAGSGRIERLYKLPNLSHLDLSGTMVDDTCSIALIELPNLDYLNIARTKISVDGVRALKDCSRLGWLIVSRHQMTETLRREFEAKVPMVAIKIEDEDDDR